MTSLVKAATPWGWPGLVGAELLSQFPGTWAPSLSPQYTVTVGFSPPVTVTSPLRVTEVVVTDEAALMVRVGAATSTPV